MRTYNRSFRAEDADGNPIPGAQVTLWAAKTGGTQITTGLTTIVGDTIAGGVLTCDAWGYVPDFVDTLDRPDLWAIGSLTGAIVGVERVLLEASDDDTRISALETFAHGAGGLDERLTGIENSRGAASGIATLDADGHVPASQLAVLATIPGTYSVTNYGAKGDGTTDDAPAIQAALNDVRDAGGGWVIVPPGTYRLATLPLRIYGRTRLTLSPGATFVRGVANTLLLNGDAAQTLGGYTGHGDLIIEGGVWDMAGTVVTASSMCISIGHARNVVVRNLEVRDLPGYHGVEYNAVKYGLIENCAFRGYIDPGGRDFSEAMQIDLAKGAAEFGGFGPYDNTPCEDITVRGCYVGPSGTAGTTSWPRGVGSHSATIGTQHRRIKVTGNTFEGTLQYAVVAYSYDDSVISGNTMKGCGSGVRARTVISTDDADTTNLSGTITHASQTMKDLVVADNVITGSTGYDDALLLYGETTGRIIGATVTGNVIDTSSAQNGIRALYAEQYTVAGNTVRSVSGTAISQQNVAGGVVVGNRIYAPGASGISCDTGTGVQIEGNAVRDAGSNGLHVLSGSDVQLVGNYVKSASRATDLAGYGIRLSSSADGVMITGNKVRRNGSGNEAANGLSVTSTCTNVKRYGNDLTNSGSTANIDDQSTSPALSPLDDDVWASYTPSWTATTTNPAIGNGTIVGRYKRVGKTVHYKVTITMGSTTTYGSGRWAVSLPSTAASTDWVCSAIGEDNSDTARRYGGTGLAGLTNAFGFAMAAAGVTNGGVGNVSGANATSPITWATGDILRVGGFYEEA